MNSINIVGRVAQDLELKKTQNDVSVCTFSVAVSRPKVKDVTDFINCVAWRQSAEYLCKYGIKGSMVAISGSLQTRKYEDKDGKKRTVFEVVADSLNLILPPKGEFAGKIPNQSKETSTNENLGANMEFEEVTDSELPF
jgi:single-strand DNA-binding protein